MNRLLHRGFTLVEILIVVVILAILASIVIPQLSRAGEQARENSLAMSLYRIRQQLEIYRNQHNGHYPSLDQFDNQMLKMSNESGDTAEIGTDGYLLGPYLQEVPVNPFTSKKTIGIGEVGTSDWYYNELTGDFAANNSEKAAKF
ncbi:Type II secretion system protein G precursor [Poriferisphaera corsica]|uniref:Type II secretion system protein G n=1 Tax=Poriferisphaera corsica TaxID=2528020 RepID=A0A517YQU8_9BACT|nr:prepilin-type N-terminal cleavage/methylation domain-containing protein [Poriferisphaera corsica]QDU32600.1 Type II secretion system protein G precursor [Poriferisphaera corsica]